MERCLKKLVWDAEATGLQDPEKGGWEPVEPSGRKTLPEVSTGGRRVYTRNRREAKKLIPGNRCCDPQGAVKARRDQRERQPGCRSA